MSVYTQVATVKFADPFDETSDAESLRAAMKGLGTNEAEIINILANRTSNQRQIIKEYYTQTLERNLIDDLKSELGGHFEDIMVTLMSPTELYLAQVLHKALQKKQDNVIIEILCTRDKTSIAKIKSAYAEEHGTDLMDDLNNLEHESAKFKVFLLALASEDRREDEEDLSIAQQLSQKLVAAGEAVEDELMEMVAQFNQPMMRLTFQEYSCCQEHDFQNVIEEKMPEEIKGVMKIVYETVCSPPTFFAKELNSAVAGTGTDDPKLIRIVMSRCEIDMGNIKEEYEKLYETSLADAIKGDTSGDYKRALLALIEC
ncbi:unnamed protein product [Meganyctiphanes norvegica]|uniref:Annexin n=1 Tax=Meganyctiphanes norvegica TaxID=48144 RepID=A0AAV2QRG2_MEGNR